MFYYEEKDGKKLLCRMENFIPFHQGLSDLFLKKLTDGCSELYEEPASLYKDKLNFKLSGGQGYRPHQVKRK
jgi:2-aminoethylphosphonate dioxygenase